MSPTGDPGLEFKDRQITVAGRSWRVDYPVTDARLLRDRVLVTYDYMAKEGFFQNLERFRSTVKSGLWRLCRCLR